MLAPLPSNDGSNNVESLEKFGDFQLGTIMKTLSLAIASNSRVVQKLLRKMAFIMG